VNVAVGQQQQLNPNNADTPLTGASQGLCPPAVVHALPKCLVYIMTSIVGIALVMLAAGQAQVAQVVEAFT
jgi:hypothetical protein